MAQRQFEQRRPSWTKGEKTYRNYRRSTIARDRSPSDYGVDNFSYDEAHVLKWTIPAHILERLPAELQKPAAEWQFAGAALCTALERIKKLDDESIYRGYPEPEKSTHPHLSRRVSNAQCTSGTASTGAGVETPPMSTPPSSVPDSFTALPLSLLPLEELSSRDFTENQVMGMESPPFTPVDSMACSTPDYPHSMPFTANAMPDVHALTRQLSPISMRGRGDSTNSSQYAPSNFDESAWDVYLNTFKAEMYDVQTCCLPRLKGLGSTIEMLSSEYARQPQYKAAIEDFNAWWAENKGQAIQWEKRVRALELPGLDHMRRERQSMGLSI